MSSIAPVSAAFGYTNYVLAHDSTLKKAPKPTAPVAPSPTPTPATSASRTAAPLAAATPAQRLQLGKLAWQSDVTTALFASTAPPAGPSLFGSTTTDARAVANEGTAFFAKAGMAAQVRTWSPAAVAYVARQAAATTGTGVVDAHA
jgi:hypothetical protein